MKKKYLLAAVFPVLAFVLVGTASAHGWSFLGGNATPEEIANHQQQMFDHQAEILGISAEDVKNAWADGKTLNEIITEKGLNKADIQKRAQDQAAAQMKSHLQTLVDKGVITQAQADKRLQFMTNQAQTGKVGRHFGHMGMKFLR